MEVVALGIVLISFGTLGMAVRALKARPSPETTLWVRLMLIMTIVMNATIPLHMLAAVYGFDDMGYALLSALIFVSPWGMLYASHMVDRSQKQLKTDSPVTESEA